MNLSIKNKNWLNRIETWGNKLPDPIFLFAGLCLVIIFLSAILSNWSVHHPVSESMVSVQNLLTWSGLQRILVEMPHNFAAFPPLTLVIITMIGIGLAERSGFFKTLLQRLVLFVPSWLLPFMLILVGIQTSLVVDAGYIVLPPLGALLFSSFGRPPLAGLACAFAGVSAGFSANFLITALDPLLASLTLEALRHVDPTLPFPPTANYFFMLASVPALSLTGALVTRFIVEPRLLKLRQSSPEKAESEKVRNLTNKEKRALFVSTACFLGLIGTIISLFLFKSPIFIDAEGSHKPFYDSLVALILIIFLLTGLIYGFLSGSIAKLNDAAEMIQNSLGGLGGYLALAFFASQFLAYFSWSNLGIVIAISGSQHIAQWALPPILILIGLFLFSALLNLVLGSSSAKWALLAPIFIPLMYFLHIPPEATQATYRIADSVTNILTPLMPYFPLILTFVRSYQPEAGIGTVIALMFPYAVAFSLVWLGMLSFWILLEVPFGF